ncbi:MAG: 4-hydroxy-3-methylbut-2-enyl diphosphate reductase [Muribaculaceae bacterium]|nr:4-hydroxy-3-methylbut-2-enyl diphosphate reductase [Muribaculaceae bacterium]
MIKVEIDSHSGFCNGVVTAIKKAETQLQESSLYCLGDIVHNNSEVDRLRQKGLVTITHEQFASLHGAKVLLRAHGEPPSTYEIAEHNGIVIIDATCPVVLALQRRIRATYDRHDSQILIYGKNGHAEVNGLVGQTNGEARVIENISDLDDVDFSKNISLYSQTTMHIDGYKRLIDEIGSRISPEVKFESFDTICRQVANRVTDIRRFAASHELILFVSGRKSSNGKVLYNQCREVNPSTRLISDEREIRAEWLEGVQTVGVCGATSTPRWLMEKIANQVEKLSEEK